MLETRYILSKGGFSGNLKFDGIDIEPAVQILVFIYISQPHLIDET